MFWGFWAWIGPYLAYFKGPKPGFEPTLGSFGGPGPGFGLFGHILSLNWSIWGIWDWIWAISGGPGPGFEPFWGVLCLF